MHEIFGNDYAVSTAELVNPYGCTFELYVTSRFYGSYKNGYEVLSSNIVKTFVQGIDCFVDVGAHYGYYSLLAATTNKNIEVIAVEPVRENFSLLERNIAYNNIDPERFILHNSAVSNCTGEQDFFISEASDNCSFYPHPSSLTLKEIKIATIALDDVIPREKKKKIFIKIDTDGHELQVFQGLEKTLAFHEDVTLLFEANPKMYKIAGTRMEEVFLWLNEHGFKLFGIDESNNLILPLSDVLVREMMEVRHAATYYNVLCLQSSTAISLVMFSHTSGLDGAGRSLLDLVRGLVVKGVICNVIVPDKGALFDSLLNAGCGVFVVPEMLRHVWRWMRPKQSGHDENISYYTLAIEAFREKLLPEVMRMQPDVIFSQTNASPWGAVCAEALGKQHFLSVREYGELDHDFCSAFGFSNAVTALYQTSSSVFCITDDVRDVLFGSDPRRVTKTVYSGIELETGQEYSDVKNDIDDFFKEKNGPIVMLAGTIQPGKGQIDLVRAVIQLGKNGCFLRCVFIGLVADKKYLSELRALCDAADTCAEFIFLDFITDIYPLMQQVDIVVSCARKEALGRTLIEASLLEKPIIYAKSGGPSHVFKSGVHGLAYNPGDYEELAKQLLHIVQNPVGATQRAESAKAYCEQQFSREKYAGTIYNTIKANLAEGTTSRDTLPVYGIISDKIHRTLAAPQLTPRFYFSQTAGGFDEVNVLFTASISFGYFESSLNLEREACCFLRFDPVEGVPVELILHSVVCLDEQGVVIDDIDMTANGITINDGGWRFLHLDPQVLFACNRAISHIRILGEIKKIASIELVRESSVLCQNQRQIISDLESERCLIKNEINLAMKELVGRDGQIAILNQTVAEREEQITRLNQTVTERENRNLTDQNHIAELECAVGAVPQQNLALEEECASCRSQIELMVHSRGWRLTAPLRRVSAAKYRIKRVLLEATVSSYLALPIAPLKKQKLRNNAFRFFGFVFKNLDAYKHWKVSQDIQTNEVEIRVEDHSRAPMINPPLLTANGLWEWQDYLSIKANIAQVKAERRQNVAPIPFEMFNIKETELRSVAAELKLPTFVAKPDVSIILPVFNNIKLTLECLLSIAQYVEPTTTFEVIVADDASTDETAEIIRSIANIRYTRSKTNLGFLRNCNRALAEVNGDYVLYLNNDVQVTAGWLGALLATFNSHKNVGAVGPRFVYPSGHLQEAGGAFMPDGTSAMIGINEDPALPRYSYIRRVDYVSGACLLLPTTLAKTVGGFSEEFLPCYCEDADLCLSVRDAGYDIYYNPGVTIIHHLSKTTASVNNDFKMRCVNKNFATLQKKWSEPLEHSMNPRLIAFYLPQYHPVPENDYWWGKGFTEWSNVSKAEPNFVGHYQPRIPADLGYYDLRLIEVMQQQAELAQRYGIHGFCYYYYWFDGKRLLERPVEQLLLSDKPDLPFCLCWANENWTRRWDGQEHEVLMAQLHTVEDDKAVINDLIRFFRDARYIKIDERPLILIYRVTLFPNFAETAARWRAICREQGIGEIYIAMVESFELVHSNTHPSTFGCDAAVEFPPQGLAEQKVPTGEILNPDFAGSVADYCDLAVRYATREAPAYTRFKGVIPGWDNTARRQHNSFCFENATPGAFQGWLEETIEETRVQNYGDERIVFVNAWNEWAEGAHLEPDRRFGHTYLEAVKNALDASRLLDKNGMDGLKCV